MKNISKSLLAIAVAGVAFVASCKKGEEDPSLSLRSRKSRVAGEWKVGSSEMKRTNNGSGTGYTSTSTTTETWTGDTYKATTSSTYSPTTGGSSTTTTSTLDGKVESNTYTFEKDGTWKQALKYTTTETETDNSPWGGSTTTTTTTVYTINKSGVWNFLGKVQDDTKNKEEMSVSTTSEDINVAETVNSVYTPTSGPTVTTTSSSSNTDVNTYANNEVVEIWKLKQLKNSEMIVTMTGKGTSTDTNSQTSGNQTTSSTSTSSHESTGTMTLTQE